MAWKHTALKLCSKLMPDIYYPPAGVLFPYAHIVSDTAPVHVRHLYAVPSIAKFESDIDFLCRQCQPLHLSDLEPTMRLRANNASVRSFVLSFDDGMREVYDVIAPILRRKGIPAIFFLNAATIDNKQLMWRHKISLLIERSRKQPALFFPRLGLRSAESLPGKLKALRFVDQDTLDEMAKSFELDFGEYLRSARPYLTTDQVLELARAGFEFGAHSASHPYFNEMSVEHQKNEILGSVRFIRELGLPCRYFAFPFHDNGVPGSVFRYMTDLGLVFSFGTSEGRVDSVEFSFQRFALDAGNRDYSVQGLLKQLSLRSVAYRLCGSEAIQRN
jgi:peptidoglycan/xylan/chitin deacetylase (PgdA/CDA1 family)